MLIVQYIHARRHVNSTISLIGRSITQHHLLAMLAQLTNQELARHEVYKFKVTNIMYDSNY